MMFIHLIKKDFMIIKKYVLIMLAISTVIPITIMKELPEAGGMAAFAAAAVFSIIILLQYVSMKEYQYPKTIALLCASPYPRIWLVFARYIFCIIVFLGCTLIFYIETLFIPGLGAFQFSVIGTAFLVIAVFVGIYLPVQYKVGYEKARFIFLIAIMGFSFGMPQFAKILSGARVKIPFSLTPFAMGCGMLLLAMGILIVSAMVSASIFSKKSLA